MTRNELLAAFARIVNSPDPVWPHQRLDALDGWDSMAIVEFLAFMDRHFGAPPSIQALSQCRVVGDLIELAGGKLDDGSQPVSRVA